jgi:hypothetical protein
MKYEWGKGKCRTGMNVGKVNERKDDSEKGCKAVGKESVKRNTAERERERMLNGDNWTVPRGGGFRGGGEGEGGGGGDVLGISWL